MSKHDLRELPIWSILPHPDNPRFDLGDLTALTVDVRDNGIIEPLVVVPGSWGKNTGQCRDCHTAIPRTGAGVLEEHRVDERWCPGGAEPARDEWFVVAGHRRLAASTAAGLLVVPCVTRHDLTTRADQIALMMRENTHRRDLTPLEEAHGYEQLTLEGLTTTRISHLVKAPKKQVDRRLALTRLPDRARRNLMAGQLSLEDAEALLDLAPERAQRALASVGTKEFRQDLARERVGSDDPTLIVRELQGQFLGPFLTGSRRPGRQDLPKVRREVVAALVGLLPRRTVKAWNALLGTSAASVDPDRALLALAVALGDTPAELLDALGYEPAPIEETS